MMCALSNWNKQTHNNYTDKLQHLHRQTAINIFMAMKLSTLWMSSYVSYITLLYDPELS